MANQAAGCSVTEAFQFLGCAETFLKRGNNNLKLRYLFLLGPLGSVKKQTRKRNSHSDWHGLMALHFQEVGPVLFFLEEQGPLKKNTSPKNTFRADLYHNTYNICFLFVFTNVQTPWGQSWSSHCHRWLAQCMGHNGHLVRARLYLMWRWILSTQVSSESGHGRYTKGLLYIMISRGKKAFYDLHYAP